MAKKVEAEPISNEWPAWYYGPGGVGEIFESADDVPDGWVSHPSEAGPPIDL